MADIIRVTVKPRVESFTAFSSHSGDVYVEKLHGEDGADFWRIWANNPTVANFNEAPVGSTIWDTADYATHSVHATATTWLSSTYS